MTTWSQWETRSLGEIVSHDLRAGAIFDRFGLDYCCGGARTLGEACRQRGIGVDQVAIAIDALDAASPAAPERDCAALVDHIINRHHAYVRRSIPVVQQHLTKVVTAHGARHPELAEVQAQFSTVATELMQHMVKEETVLFPYIYALAAAVEHKAPPPPDMFGTVQNPIRMMEIEHQEAGDGVSALRELTRGYEPPDDACDTYRMVLRELAAFEQDLHEHVHLENNVLFPKAIELEEKTELMARGLKCQTYE